jgi:uridylate kinase
MEEVKYKRVLLKISGEALAGERHTGLDFEVVGQVCDAIREAVAMGVQVGVVIGAGNFWRGAKDGGGRMERTRADHMGMLGTAMNCLAVADVLEQKGVPARVQTALEIRSVAEPYVRGRAIHHLEKGRVVVFGCGTGNPFLHGYRRRSAGRRDRGGCDPAGQERGRRLQRRPGEGPRRREVRRYHLR